MLFLEIIYYTLAGIFGFFLVFPFLKVVAERLTYRPPVYPTQLRQYDYAVIITAYKDADITKPGVRSLLAQRYPNVHIYLVADACDVTDYGITDARFTLLRPTKPLQLKAKSIIYATERFVRKPDFIIIFDADNVAHADYLETLNREVNLGYKVMQGQRTAKNLDSGYAGADSLGEFYKNYVERLVPPRLGSSAVISGSGMAVERKLYLHYLNGKDIQRGKHKWKKMLQEDKILQNFLLNRKHRIGYCRDAIVFDEKVSDGAAVTTQRSRWLYSYFQNTPNSSGLLWRGLTSANWNQILFGLITIAPPLFLLVGCSVLLAVVGWFVHPGVSLALVVGLVLFSLNVLWTLQLSNAPREVWQAVWSTPKFIGRQVVALFKMVNPNKNFKHTEHRVAVEAKDLT